MPNDGGDIIIRALNKNTCLQSVVALFTQFLEVREFYVNTDAGNVDGAAQPLAKSVAVSV